MELLTVGIACLAILFLASIAPTNDAGYEEEEILSDGAVVEKLAGGFQFLEGPVWTSDGALVFSDIPADTMYRWKNGEMTTYRHPSRNANGNTLDREGRIITCEHGSRRVTRGEPDGGVTVLAERFDGRRLNSPNDVVVKSNGDVYFTDPPYGIHPEESELGFNGIYRLTPDGSLHLLSNEMDRPNGLAFSPDEKRLYVSDSGSKNIRAFNVDDTGHLSNGQIFAEIDTSRPGSPDGMRIDLRGRLYCTGSGGIQVYAPSGRHLLMIETPEVPANCAWGDDGRMLYITARTGLYRIRTVTGGRLSVGSA